MLYDVDVRNDQSMLHAMLSQARRKELTLFGIMLWSFVTKFLIAFQSYQHYGRFVVHCFSALALFDCLCAQANPRELCQERVTLWRERLPEYTQVRGVSVEFTC
jgi:hypothetical protein